MSHPTSPGLAELLRQLVELTDGAADNWYRAQGLDYRPRYTPIMQALANGPATVAEIQQNLALTQGAVSQTLNLMLEDGLIEKHQGENGRQSVVSLSARGQALLEVLLPHWEATSTAIQGLETEIETPLVDCLKRSVAALAERSFADRIGDARALAAEGGKARRNPFETGGARYAELRPGYPAELAESLAAVSSGQGLALDVGCGNGQLTARLAPHFQDVVGIDPSESQLGHAASARNITYLACSAEAMGLPDDSVDLITVAQAAHWFDLEKFYAEARRVAKHGAVIALISYGVPCISDAVNTVFQQGYWRDVHEFWPRERVHVETGYAMLPFPFAPVRIPAHHCRAELTVDQLIDYITTWSAYARASALGKQASFERYFERLRKAWQGDASKEVVWPISIKAGRIQTPGTSTAISRRCSIPSTY